MKRIAALVLLVGWLMAAPATAQPGLKGEYYKGTNFDQKVLTRTDPELSFNWRGSSPASGMPKSYYSIRWTGKLLAPVTGKYGFFAKVDDGIRLWIGNQKVMDSWQLNDSKNYSGSIVLEAGHYYDLRVDYFNDMLEGEIELYWQRPDVKKTPMSPVNKSSELITAQYFFQKSPPIAALPKPNPVPPTEKPITRPQVVVKPKEVALPKPMAKAVSSPTPKPVVLEKPIPDTATRVEKTAPVINPQSDFKSGTTVILYNVQFEQSSYVLLSESYTDLDKLVLAMKTNPLWYIDVAGHTDNIGDPRLNLALSENRAKVVANYMKRRGIADDRMTTIGYGGTRPIADNASERERPKNRRVEITIK